jgi:hypothetical protein
MLGTRPDQQKDKEKNGITKALDRDSRTQETGWDQEKWKWRRLLEETVLFLLLLLFVLLLFLLILLPVAR